MTHPPNLFPLKLVVISLGFILFAGIVFILVTIASRAREELHTAHCEDAVLHLGTGELVSVTPQGKLVQVTVRDTGMIKVLTADRCSGKILQTLTIAP